MAIDMKLTALIETYFQYKQKLRDWNAGGKCILR
jgi:hypothetical protein